MWHRQDFAVFDTARNAKKRRTLQKERLDLEDTMEDEIHDKISAAQQASEGEVKQERLFEVRFSIS